MKKCEAAIGLRVRLVGKPMLDSPNVLTRNWEGTICEIPEYGSNRGYVKCQLDNGKIENWCLNRLAIINP